MPFIEYVMCRLCNAVEETIDDCVPPVDWEDDVCYKCLNKDQRVNADERIRHKK